MSTWKSLFDYDFTANSGNDVDRSIWASPHWTQEHNASSLGRTGIRNPKDFGPTQPEYAYVPVSSTDGAQLRLGPYNPLAAGKAMLGTVIYTTQSFGGNGKTYKWEAVAKCPTMPGGGVCGIFPYAITDINSNSRDEVDTELVSNFFSANKQYNANLYMNNNDSPGWHPQLAADFNFQEYHTYTMITGPSGTTWHIDGVEVLSESGTPAGAMSFYFNFWAPAANGWTWAYSADIEPSTTPATEWVFSVKSCSVSVQS